MLYTVQCQRDSQLEITKLIYLFIVRLRKSLKSLQASVRVYKVERGHDKHNR